MSLSPNITAYLPLLLDHFTHEDLTTIPTSKILPLTSPLSSITCILFLLIQTTLFLATHTYRTYKHKQLLENQRVATLEKDLHDLREKLTNMEEAFIQSPLPLPLPPVSLLASKEPGPGEFDEFGRPPPLDEDDDFELPAPALGLAEGHAAFERFYRLSLELKLCVFPVLAD